MAISSSEATVLGVFSAAHGFDDVGIDQPSGAITGAADATGYAGRRFPSKVMFTVSGATAPEKGQPFNITGNSYAGLTRVLHKVSATRVIVDKAFGATGVTGSWDMKGGQSAWVGMMPIGADLATSSINTLTFWDEGVQTGTEKAVPYTKDKVYMFPGVIKTILLATSGNVRLFRHGTLKPDGSGSQS